MWRWVAGPRAVSSRSCVEVDTKRSAWTRRHPRHLATSGRSSRSSTSDSRWTSSIQLEQVSRPGRRRSARSGRGRSPRRSSRRLRTIFPDCERPLEAVRDPFDPEHESLSAWLTSTPPGGTRPQLRRGELGRDSADEAVRWGVELNSAPQEVNDSIRRRRHSAPSSPLPAYPSKDVTASPMRSRPSRAQRDQRREAQPAPGPSVRIAAETTHRPPRPAAASAGGVAFARSPRRRGPHTPAAGSRRTGDLPHAAPHR